MSGFVQFLSRFGPARLAAMGAVTLALVGFFAFVMLRVTQPAMGVLFTELAAGDSGAVTRELDARGIRYESREDGATVLVPKSDLARIRMDLAGKGLPAGGTVGYEVFDKGDAFTSTSFVQNINHQRALEGELSRTIRTIGRVAAARVHLALPERRLFERDREAPRASIVLKLRGELGADQVAAIRHLVASAVEGLVPERVSVVDERGRLLADGSGSADGSITLAAGEDKRVALERRVRGQVEDIVAGIVGPGRTRVQVSAELDFNRIESRSENFDPDGRVVRSTQTRGENSTTANGEGQVSVGTELPGARDNGNANAPREQTNKNEELVNYEISRTTRTEVQQAGRLKRLSVAVLVDGVYGKGANGESTYQPRSKEDLERMTALVRSAVGFDAKRGDQVEVVNLPFAEAPSLAEPDREGLLASLVHPSRDDILRFGELGIISLLVLIVLMVVVRPMVRRVIAPELLGAGGAGPALAAADGPALAAAPTSPAIAFAGAGGGGEVALPAIGGTVGADRVAQLGAIAGGNPKGSAEVLRGWMSGR